MRPVFALALLAVLGFAAGGCGSAKKAGPTTRPRATLPLGEVVRPRASHTYVYGVAKGGSLAKGITITFVSPIAIPTWPSQVAKNGGHPSGPRACSFAKHVHGLHGQNATLNGKVVTVTVNGSGHLASTICSRLKRLPFDPKNAA